MHFLLRKSVLIVASLAWSSLTFAVDFIVMEAPGVASVVPNAVSADGSAIVGRAVFPAGEGTVQRAFRWYEGEGFETFAPVLGATASASNAVSANGAILVGGTNSTALNYPVGVRWSPSESLPIFDGNSTNHRATAEALGVSADGTVIVGFHRNNSDHVRAFHWVANPDGAGGAFTSFGEILPGTSRGSGIHTNRFNAVSADGRFLVGWSDGIGHSGSAPVQGVRVDRQTGDVIALGFLPGGQNQSSGHAVSADGQVIAGFASSTVGESSGAQYFRWTPETGMVGLGFLYGTGVNRLGLSGDGQTIVGASNDRAIIWTESTGMVFLDTIAPQLASWEASYATGVSHDGHVITGYGFPEGVATSSGNEVGWVIRQAVSPPPPPPPPPPPAPATPTLVISGANGTVTLAFDGESDTGPWSYRVDSSINLIAWDLFALVSPAGVGEVPVVSAPDAAVEVTMAPGGETFSVKLTESPGPRIFYRVFPVIP